MISNVIREETIHFLQWMREHPKEMPAYLRARLSQGEEPTTWDINNGFCEDLAEAVAARIPGAEVVPAYDPELHPLREDGGYDADHFVVVFEGRFYDCECPEGVDRVRALPIYQNRGKTRAQVLKERPSTE